MLHSFLKQAGFLLEKYKHINNFIGHTVNMLIVNIENLYVEYFNKITENIYIILLLYL